MVFFPLRNPSIILCTQTGGVNKMYENRNFVIGRHARTFSPYKRFPTPIHCVCARVYLSLFVFLKKKNHFNFNNYLNNDI